MIKFKIACISLLVMCGQIAFSQTKTLSGTVLDDTGAPLPGASIVVSGTTNGTQSDFDGNFTINANSDATLLISYIGFITKKVIVGNQNTIKVQLEVDNNVLDEIVVVGYGSQSRADVTGAISTISADDITSIPVATADQALQGRAAGITVLNSGSPGSAPVVKIRGIGTPNNSNPLYVIDGVISNGLGDLNANDIASISVLKDASTTAIYGSQGANGVVMVTTKNGTSGKVKMSFNTYSGTQFTTERFDLLNTQEYLQYAGELGLSPTRANIASTTTNWQDEIFTSGIVQNYDLNVSGGGENSNFRISAGYLNQEGTIVETGFERYSFRANSNFSLGKFNIGETMSVAFNGQNPENQNGGRSLIEHAIKMAPYLPVYNTNNLGGFQGPNNGQDGQDAENPVRAQTLGEALNKSVAISGSIFGEYEIIEGLKFKSQAGLQYRTFNNNRFIPSYNDDSEGATHSFSYAQITKNSGTLQTIQLTNSLNYEKTLNDVHNFELLLLADKYENKLTGINITSQNPISDQVDQVSLEQATLTSNSSETNRIGYLGRLNYNYDGKYLFAASLRRDATSRFGANNRWGTFPSVALGWNIAKEDFLLDSDISNLKFRGSWGVVGNDAIPDYQYSATLTSNFNYPIAGANAVGTTANGLANPNLKWEETTMKNIGLDFGFLNDKITGTVEYYNNTSDDLLIQRTLPISLGIHAGTITENVGSVETKGFEFSLGYNDFEGDFTWSANLNLGTTKNEVLSLGLLDEFTGGSFENQNISRSVVGEALFHFYGLETDGIYQNEAEVAAVFTAPGSNDVNTDTGERLVQPGDIRFKDLNEDGNITADDRTVIGNPYPKLNFGLNLNGAYKNFDFNVFINGVSGNDIYNTNIYDLEGMNTLFNSSTSVLNRWTTSNASTTIPRAQGTPRNVAISDRFVEDGSFTRLKNITLGYTIPDNSGFSKYVSKLRIYVSGQNLITFTDYSGLDPEIGNSTVINNTRYEVGIDRGTYPQPKTLLAGLQITF